MEFIDPTSQDRQFTEKDIPPMRWFKVVRFVDDPKPFILQAHALSFECDGVIVFHRVKLVKDMNGKMFPHSFIAHALRTWYEYEDVTPAAGTESFGRLN